MKKLAIQGHTDAVGDELRNMDLSRLRARAVFLELARLEVPKELLEPQGFGETRPIADNATRAGRTKNRRVEFVILEPRPKGQECFF